MDDWVCFISEMHVLKPDVIWLEITEYTPEEFHGNAAKSLDMKMISGIDNPARISCPSRRPRRHSFLWGERVDFKGSFAEYESIFTRASVLTGEDVLFETDPEHQLYMREVAEKQKKFFPVEYKLTLSDVLSPSAARFFNEHLDEMRHKANLDGVYITDLEQKPSRVSSGALVPTLVKHGTLVSLRGEPKMYNPKEHLFIVGESLHPEYNDDYGCYFMDVLDDPEVNGPFLKKISGNAMHMISMGCFMLYCMSRLELCATAALPGPPQVFSSSPGPCQDDKSSLHCTD